MQHAHHGLDGIAFIVARGDAHVAGRAAAERVQGPVQPRMVEIQPRATVTGSAAQFFLRVGGEQVPLKACSAPGFSSAAPRPAAALPPRNTCVAVATPMLEIRRSSGRAESRPARHHKAWCRAVPPAHRRARAPAPALRPGAGQPARKSLDCARASRQTFLARGVRARFRLHQAGRQRGGARMFAPHQAQIGGMPRMSPRRRWRDPRARHFGLGRDRPRHLGATTSSPCATARQHCQAGRRGRRRPPVGMTAAASQPSMAAASPMVAIRAKRASRRS